MKQQGNSPEEPGAPESPASSGPQPDDPRVIAALEEYALALRAGQPPDRQSFQARHPEIAPVLAECLDGLEWMRVVARGNRLAASMVGQAVTGVKQGASLGEYRIVREIGRGGMGIVYEAVQESLDRRVALKVLPFASTLDARQLQRFENEARAAAGLHHSNIVPVFATGCAGGVHYYAMQLIEGQTLAALIDELRRQPVPDDNGAGASDRSRRSTEFFRLVAQLGVQAAEALTHAHQLGVVHRDIKPGNLLVQGELSGAARPRLWITDFGLAHCRRQAGLTMTGDRAGTLRYMSPEQAGVSPAPIDHRTDIYSLGVTLYELLTLAPAFPGHDRQELLRRIAVEEPPRPRRLNRAIPAALEIIVLKSMEKNPADRYSTAKELAEELEGFLQNESIRASLLIQQAINAILRISLAPISLDEQLHRILSLILELPWLALERKGTIYLADEQARVLVRKAQVGMPPGALSTCGRVPFGACLCGRAIASREVVFASCVDACHTIRYPGIAPHGHYCVPICSGERPIGLLNLYVREGRPRLAMEEHFLCAVADILAGIIKRQQTEERLREQLRLAAFGQEIQRQESDRRIARVIQQALAPKAMPRVAGFQIAGRLATGDPAGGECFDFVPIARAGQERLGVLIGAAGGQGIAAALLMAETRACLRALALTCSDVGTLLSLANRLLVREPVASRFVTLLLVEIDSRSRSLVYAGAGHCPAYVLDRHGEIKSALCSTGPPLGVDPASEFPTARELSLAPGDVIFACTGGIPQALSGAWQPCGLERALGVVRAHRRETPEAILERLVHAVSDFAASPLRHEDRTAVLIKAEEGA
jgi:serine/threonine protein kinase/serine phosphatase RsbU (regulator of sigma subunit)